ncbi:MAG: cysteine desulfurase [Alphaproteobacteria bacterium]|nr:cysteine desulfurase [Alphaproteobacteria bacterium]
MVSSGKKRVLLTQKLTYLDHNATTPLKPEVRDVMLRLLEFPGNASAIHKLGREARRRIEEARAQIAGFVNAGPKAVIVFTSGATEANNLVLKGSGCERVLVSAIEHPSVLNALAAREIIPVLSNGVIDVAALDQMLEGNDRATLISVMMVNNETGVIQPLDKVVEIAKRRGALVHTDAVQAAGRLPIDLQKLGVDYLTLSAHKIGGPQGAGCLVLSNCVSVTPQISGGNQEKNMRAGTENLAAIAGFGVAAELAARDMGGYQALAALRDRIEAELKKIAPAIRFFGQESPRVANTTMFALPGAPSETQLIALDMAGICVSNGSACSSGAVRASHVLKAMGASEAEAGSSLRISLGWNSTEKEVDYFIQQWTEMYNRIKSRVSAA